MTTVIPFEAAELRKLMKAVMANIFITQVWCANYFHVLIDVTICQLSAQLLHTAFNTCYYWTMLYIPTHKDLGILDLVPVFYLEGSETV